MMATIVAAVQGKIRNNMSRIQVLYAVESIDANLSRCCSPVLLNLAFTNKFSTEKCYWLQIFFCCNELSTSWLSAVLLSYFWTVLALRITNDDCITLLMYGIGTHILKLIVNKLLYSFSQNNIFGHFYLPGVAASKYI